MKKIGYLYKFREPSHEIICWLTSSTKGRSVYLIQVGEAQTWSWAVIDSTSTNQDTIGGVCLVQW